MKISARVSSSHGQNNIVLQTNDHIHSITIPPRATGFGSSANGGELLFLAVATCYVNDIYREAAKRSITVTHVEVDVHGEFGDAGVTAHNVTYNASVTANAGEQEIIQLMRDTDRIAEIHGSLRIETPVTLNTITAKSTT